MLNYKMIKILHLFLKHEILYLNDLSKILNIQKRSVISCIDELNDVLIKNKFKIIEFVGDSIFYILNNEKFQYLLEKNKYIFSPQERRTYLIYQLINDQIVDQKSYENIFEVSKSLYEKDLFAVKNYLKINNIKFATNDKGILKVQISQFQKRSIVIGIINEYLNTKLISLLFQIDELSTKIIQNIKNEFDGFFTDSYLEFIKIYWTFLIKTYKISQFVSIDSKDLRDLKITREYLYSKELLEKYFGLKDVNEISYLTILLIGGNISFKLSKNNQLFSKIYQAILEFIFEVERQALFIFINKEKLVEEVIKHFIPSYYRLKYGIKLSWNFYEIIDEKYKFHFEKLKASIYIIENFLQIQFNERELTLFLIYFILNLNSNIQNKQWKAAIISDAGTSIAKIQKNEIENLFHNISIIDVDNWKSIDKRSNLYDLIFSNDAHQNSKIIAINKILTKTDITKIQKQLKMLELQNKARNQTLKNILSIDHINIFEKKYNWQQAIEISSQSLVKDKCFDERYIKSMIANIEKYGPYIILKKGLAIPHSSRKDGINKVGIALNIFKQTISFDSKDQNKDVNILVTFCSQDNSSHLQALVELIDIVKEQQAIDKLLGMKTSKQVFNFIFKKEKQKEN